MAGARRAVLWRRYASYAMAFALLFACPVAMLLLLAIPVNSAAKVIGELGALAPEYAAVTLIAAGVSVAATRTKRIRCFFAKRLGGLNPTNARSAAR